ncbi:MAG: sulfate adenylyltransferase [Elusimicrobiota bacterium]
MINPHGGDLVERLEFRSPSIEKTEKVISIGKEDYTNLENIAVGIYSPLKGFMGKKDYDSVLERGRLANGVPWTIPILFHLEQEQAKKIKKGETVFFKYKEDIVASIKVGSIYKIDPKNHSEKIFGTTDEKHPGVKKINSLSPWKIGGDITLFKRPSFPVFVNYHLTPKETRILFKERGWKTVVAFQTRNVPHLGHEYVQKSALTVMDGLFINPLMGKKKKGDFKDEVILNAYNILMENYYPPERAVMSVLPCEMHYAGPREAIFHAIMRKNFGCTHFIVGRDHAGVGNFYGPFDSHKIFDRFPDLEIDPIIFRSFFKCKKCGSIANDKICPHSDKDIINFSGTSIRKALIEGKKPSPEVMRPEVAEEILSYENPFVD